MANMCWNRLIIKTDEDNEDRIELLSLLGEDMDFNNLYTETDNESIWPSYLFDVEMTDTDTHLEFIFMTKHNPPLRVIAKLVDEFPELYINFDFDLPSEGFNGMLYSLNGTTMRIWSSDQKLYTKTHLTVDEFLADLSEQDIVFKTILTNMNGLTCNHDDKENGD